VSTKFYASSTFFWLFVALYPAISTRCIHRCCTVEIRRAAVILCFSCTDLVVTKFFTTEIGDTQLQRVFVYFPAWIIITAAELRLLLRLVYVSRRVFSYFITPPPVQNRAWIDALFVLRGRCVRPSVTKTANNIMQELLTRHNWVYLAPIDNVSMTVYLSLFSVLISYWARLGCDHINALSKFTITYLLTYFTARWSTWPGNHRVPGDFQVTCFTRVVVLVLVLVLKESLRTNLKSW